ncbi:hypothetical protein SORBI_3007G212250 [Sorghum bicolor]|uniref:Uncharacterized protein n=1 Tax=Sorghum bicolor TaxID=4558 RepID=A0A1Z5RB17_SORBI|nr:hypothetical protein SORBI_3007G212250 [Sorghum bicolor]
MVLIKLECLTPLGWAVGTAWFTTVYRGVVSWSTLRSTNLRTTPRLGSRGDGPVTSRPRIKYACRLPNGRTTLVQEGGDGWMEVYRVYATSSQPYDFDRLRD